MQRIFLYISVFLILVSCQDIEEMEKPEQLIPEEKMVEILTDLSIISSASLIYSRKIDAKIGVAPVDSMYKKYGIDSVQFAKSSKYYAENYLVYERIYDSVKSNLERLKIKYELLKEKQIKEDSIKAARKDSLLAEGKEVPLDSLPADSTGVLAEPLIQ
ncbi:MAG TPA: DUF4296 domain-containing protein [Salinimicrobium sp.]|nr:DUF4296 domain-containing protein [Salinimicrobium sp.]